jgi:hypothetical protein
VHVGDVTIKQYFNTKYFSPSILETLPIFVLSCTMEGRNEEEIRRMFQDVRRYIDSLDPEALSDESIARATERQTMRKVGERNGRLLLLCCGCDRVIELDGEESTTVHYNRFGKPSGMIFCPSCTVSHPTYMIQCVVCGKDIPMGIESIKLSIENVSNTGVLTHMKYVCCSSTCHKAQWKKTRKKVYEMGYVAALNQCMQCGHQGKSLRKCSGCHFARYCDSSCQRIHWNRHKKDCRKAQEISNRRRV